LKKKDLKNKTETERGKKCVDRIQCKKYQEKSDSYAII